MNTILVIGDIAENRDFLTRALFRAFPKALVEECQTSTAAITLLKSEPPELIIVHRAIEMDETILIPILRQANATVPIVVVSGRANPPSAEALGVDAMLRSDSWHLIGAVVRNIVARAQEKRLAQVWPQVREAQQ